MVSSLRRINRRLNEKTKEEQRPDDGGGNMEAAHCLFHPHNYTNPTTALRESLDKGWLVVMCNNTYLENNHTCLEYILEKDVPEN